MTVNHGPFRVDHVGSFLRPKELVEAREAFAGGTISKEELTAVEDLIGIWISSGAFKELSMFKLQKAIIFMGKQLRQIRPSSLVRLLDSTIPLWNILSF